MSVRSMSVRQDRHRCGGNMRGHENWLNSMMADLGVVKAMHSGGRGGRAGKDSDKTTLAHRSEY
jgi:hypothetical protein